MDAPPTGVSSIMVTTSNIEVHKSGASEDSWISVVKEEKTFDLVTIQGAEMFLGQKDLEAGQYTQIRLDVNSVKVVLLGAQLIAKLPGEKLKVVGPWEVKAGQRTILTLDFDADKFVVITGRDEAQVKPVIKLEVSQGERPLKKAAVVSDTTPPSVSSTSPVINGNDIPISSAITATFSEAMNSSTFTADTFSLKQGGTTVSGAVTYGGLVATFIPSVGLTNGTIYTATITTGVKDLAGNALAANYVWSFTTVTAPGGGVGGGGGGGGGGVVWDIIAPAVTTTVPSNLATGVALGSTVVANFSEQMNLTGSTFTVTGPGGVSVAGTVAYGLLTATFTPSSNFAQTTTYTATITGAKDLVGNVLAGNPYAWTFTTADTTAPTVSSTIAANVATGVATNTIISATLSEAMDFSLANLTVTGPLGVAVPGTISYVGTAAIFRPSGLLTAFTVYTAILTGAKDLAGNTMTLPYVWSFTTGAGPDSTAPSVTSTMNANGATGVPVNTKVGAFFTEGMDAATITTATFTLSQGATPVAGVVTCVGTGATFSPSGNLLPSTLYTATITTGAKDLAGNPMASSYVWSWTTAAAPKTTAPTVTSTFHANHATGVALNTRVGAVFSEAMDPLTINTATFTLKQGVTPVAGTVMYAGLTAVFIPSANLLPSTVYTVTVTTGVKDLAGNAMASPFVLSWTTGTGTDSTAPMVDFTMPTNLATGVSLNSVATAFFSEMLDPLTATTVTFTLTGPGATPVGGSVISTSLGATFFPFVNLLPSTLYTATITTGVKDMAGNPLAAPYTWSYTTSTGTDTTAPFVSSTDPANSAVGVPINSKLNATFSEGMNPLTINNTTVVLKRGLTPVSGTVTYIGLVATFTPLANLLPNTSYTVTISSGIRDVAGNAMTADFTWWSFTTGPTPDTTAPMVTSTINANGATGVPVNTKIGAFFSEAMDPLTINSTTFTVTQGGAPVLGTVTYTGVAATFSPLVNLLPSTVYVVTITTGAKDLAGNAMASPYVLSWTTGTLVDTTAPIVTSTINGNGSVGVPVNTNVGAFFSEAMDHLTINTTTFMLKQGLTPVSGAVTYTGVAATFNPFVNLSPSTLYTATITTGAKDLAGNALATPYVWSWTTGANTDTIAPFVSSISPANLATGVPVNTKLNATFSEAMNPLTITTATITLKQGLVSVLGTVTYVGVTATFAPSTNLAPNTTYTATITAGVKDLAGNAMDAAFIWWTFTTGLAADTTAPFVSSTNPANLATGVPVNSALNATFSETMDPLTINPSTVMLKQGVTPVLGAVTYVGVVGTFTPFVNLAPNTAYTVVITTGIKDLAGNAMISDFTWWSFTTGPLPDTTAPQVSSTIPTNGAMGVTLNSTVNATFSEAMNPLTITTATIMLKQGLTPVPGAVTYVGTTATLAPFASLLPTTVYTATITIGARDLAGNALAAPYTWSFTTGAAPDTTLPLVSSTIPANLAVGVALNSTVTATFSEAMGPLTITGATFTLNQGVTPVLGAVSYIGITATFTPLANLLPTTLYTATITTGARDLAGNALASPYVWTFTTGAAPDTTAPLVSSTIPMNLATGVTLGSTVIATFSEAMDPFTINTTTVTLKQGLTPVLGAVSYIGITATFTPLANLSPLTLYTATITTGARDLAGNALASPYVWTFTTGATPDTTAPLVSSTIPLNLAVGVPLNSTVTATFSEAMGPLTITGATFTLNQGVTPVLGAVSYIGATATFTPLANLLPTTLYTATITTGARDLAGNALASPYVWTFTTGAAPDALPPTVISTNPANLAIGVAVNANVNATFSEAMDPTTITTANVKVAGPGITPIVGTVAYDVLNKIATFTPAGNLASNTLFTGTIAIGARDLAGNALVVPFTWTFTTGIAVGGQAPVVLGAASTFAVMATSSISSTGATQVNGDVGLAPGTSQGIPPPQVNGTIHVNDAAVVQAQAALLTAYNDAVSRSTNSVTLPGNMGGLTFTPGLYTNSTSVLISGAGPGNNVTLDAQGDAGAVFIFKMGSTLTTGPGSQVILAGGAKAANVYWQVGSSATLNTTTIFKGNILASVTITTNTGSVVEGRLLAASNSSGSVTLNATTITVPAP